MGSTAPLLESLRTTMGMLVTGSIIRPRIFISISIAASGASGDMLANQAVCSAARDQHLNVFSQQIHTRRREIYDAVARGASRPLLFAPGRAVHQEFKRLPDQPVVARDLDGALAIL